jgi:hypothetical protein
MTAKEIASICNNDGQGVEFIVRKFFDESYGKYIQAKRLSPLALQAGTPPVL